ncbi:uncharacterized protein Tco025E_06691 [Trypanosoma conorhini]|uniref:Uncharacterized protein n=1 Tax=Trypanosoma conorhini TaxID=83891 RepID=A0A3R7M8J9_9TRYP|nr:uncharacterized protein Tco025E_06691 [Trypanosoma conorhini]RNF11007.1 hypothetical protein Tco025E_06691 [Trypanosoma conorhini]
MHATVAPGSYWAALQKQLAASNPPATRPATAATTSSSPSRGARGHPQHGKGVVIENSSLLGGLNDPDEAMAFRQSSAAAAAAVAAAGELVQVSPACNGSGRTRSLVVDFIDECVRRGVSESVIVEHVMFMVHAMQEEINLTEALHARFHQDRLRQYEMLELSKTLERQRVYHDEQQQQQQQQQQGSNRKKPHEPAKENKDLVQSQEREGNAPPWRQARWNAAPVVGGRVGGRRGRQALPSSNESRARVAFTQTPLDGTEPQRQERGGNWGTAAATFQRFMRPTDASNRKERRKYRAVSEELHAPPPPPRVMRAQKFTTPTLPGARCRRLPLGKDAFARRGRQRLVGKPGSAGDSHLTWSDDDDDGDDEDGNTLPLPKYPGEGRSPNPRAEDAPQLEGEATPSDTVLSSLSPPRSETLRAGDGVPATGLDVVDKGPEKRQTDLVGDLGRWAAGSFPATATVSASAAAPPLSACTPSFFPSPQLQAYIEQSRRKVREVERVLASTPECSSMRGAR